MSDVEENRLTTQFQDGLLKKFRKNTVLKINRLHNNHIKKATYNNYMAVSQFFHFANEYYNVNQHTLEK